MVVGFDNDDNDDDDDEDDGGRGVPGGTRGTNSASQDMGGGGGTGGWDGRMRVLSGDSDELLGSRNHGDNDVDDDPPPALGSTRPPSGRVLGPRSSGSGSRSRSNVTDAYPRLGGRPSLESPLANSAKDSGLRGGSPPSRDAGSRSRSILDRTSTRPPLSRGSTRGRSPPSPGGLLRAELRSPLVVRSPAAAPVALLAGSDDDDDDDMMCEICMDEGDLLAVRKCGHRMCVECAAELLRLHPSDPVPCPFCRGPIWGFDLARSSDPFM